MNGDGVGAFVLSHYNYWIVVLLMMLGLYAVFASGNLVKRLVGLGVFQTSVFLLYITAGKVSGGAPPILPETHHGDGHGDDHGGDHGDAHGAGAASDHGVHGDVDDAVDHGGRGGVAAPGGDAEAAGAFALPRPEARYGADALDAVYSNPLPHVLILTAIVVGVATLAVGLALVVRIRDAYGVIEDEEIEHIEHDQELADAAAVAPAGETA